MEQITNFIKPELLLLVPVLYFIGTGLKRSKLADRFIPLILGGMGIALAFLAALPDIMGKELSSVVAAIFTAVTQGILCAGTSVYINQLLKQAGKGKEDDEKTD